MESETYRIRLSGEDLKRFNEIKESIGASTPEVFRILIRKYIPTIIPKSEVSIPNSPAKKPDVIIKTPKGDVAVPRETYDEIVALKAVDEDAAWSRGLKVLGVEHWQFDCNSAKWGNVILNYFK